MMRLMQGLLVVWSCAVVGVGCTPVSIPEGRIGRIDVEFTPKESCLPVVNYQLSCLSAVQLRMVPESGGDVVERCITLDVDDRPTHLFNFMTGNDVLQNMHVAKGRWRLQVRGVHDTDVDAGFGSCDAANDADHWLFWGESEVVDFDALIDSDAGVLQLNIRLECRDCQDGCGGLGSEICPARMPPAFCVPSDSQFTCARTCQDDQACFDASLSCVFEDGDDNGRCAPDDGDPVTGEPMFCAPCDTAADCATGFFCVGTDGNRFCARDCPHHFCPRGATCNRLGAGLAQF